MDKKMTVGALRPREPREPWRCLDCAFESDLAVQSMGHRQQHRSGVLPSPVTGAPDYTPVGKGRRDASVTERDAVTNSDVTDNGQRDAQIVKDALSPAQRAKAYRDRKRQGAHEPS